MHTYYYSIAIAIASIHSSICTYIGIVIVVYSTIYNINIYTTGYISYIQDR